MVGAHLLLTSMLQEGDKVFQLVSRWMKHIQCKQGISFSTDLELEGVRVCPPAKVAVPDGAVVDVLLSEGSRGCEASVVG